MKKPPSPVTIVPNHLPNANVLEWFADHVRGVDCIALPIIAWRISDDEGAEPITVDGDMLHVMNIWCIEVVNAEGTPRWIFQSDREYTDWEELKKRVHEDIRIRYEREAKARTTDT